MDQHEIGGIGDELPEWLRGIGDASILRRSRNDIERTGVTREPAAAVAVMVVHTFRGGPVDTAGAPDNSKQFVIVRNSSRFARGTAAADGLFGEAIAADDDEAAATAAAVITFALADGAKADAIISSA